MTVQGPQRFGSNPIAMRDSQHYQEEYVTSFVEKWDELIDWESRAESEGRFFIDLLKQYGKRTVLDVATGTGFHSVRLAREGFEVISADGSPEMLSMAFSNGRRYGLILRTAQADWRWLNRDINGKYDAVICLGNSFTHLFSERDRRKALAEFYAALRHDGILILDQRNYDQILDEGFSSKHKYYYCGDRVSAEPAISPQHVSAAQGLHPAADDRGGLPADRDLRRFSGNASRIAARFLHPRRAQALRDG